MATHRTTLYADRLADQQARLMDIARDLMRPEMTVAQRLEVGFRVGEEVLSLGQVAEWIRTGQRPPDGEGNEEAA